MPWTRPTLAQLQERISADISSRLLDGGALLSRSVLRVLATMQAGAAHLLHGFLEWCFKQCFMDVAEAEYLERWARIWSVVRKTGSRGTGTMTLAGVAGTIVPEGQIVRSVLGNLYRVTADATTNDEGVASLKLQAAEPGSAANVEQGEELQLVSPVPGMDMAGVSHGISGGTDDELDDSLRARLLAKLQAPPHGGNKADYAQWALEVPGVTRAWCIPLWLGLGSVGVTFVCDGNTAGEEGIIPTAEMVARVQTYIDKVKPVTAAVVVFAPQPLPVPVTAVIAPYSQGLADRITYELQDLFVRDGAPGAVIPRTHINEAISVTPGEFDHTLIEPADNVTPLSHQLPVLGTVTITGAE